MAAAGEVVAGNIMFANDTQEVFFVAVGSGLVPLSSIVLTGSITGTPGPAGPQGPAGADGQIAEQIQATAIAMAIALG
jgi:hypothetical protein